MSKLEEMLELVNIYQTRHSRVKSTTAKQFYAGAVHALQTAMRLDRGDRSDLENLRRVEMDFQKENKK